MRAIDSTTIRQPARSDRLAFALHIDLGVSRDDWKELTDAKKDPESRAGTDQQRRRALGRTGTDSSDRKWVRVLSVEAGGDLVVRVRWTHALLHDASGKRFRALTHARRLRVGKPGDWSVRLPVPDQEPIAGQVVAVRLRRPSRRGPNDVRSSRPRRSRRRRQALA